MGGAMNTHRSNSSSARRRIAAQELQSVKAFAGRVSAQLSLLIGDAVAGKTSFTAVDPICGFDPYVRTYLTGRTRRFVSESGANVYGLSVDVSILKMKRK